MYPEVELDDVKVILDLLSHGTLNLQAYPAIGLLQQMRQFATLSILHLHGYYGVKYVEIV